MRVKNFSASGVHGFYNFEFNFESDVSFLVGINGTGKTTALKLMQAALSIDLVALLEFSFGRLRIAVESVGVDYILDVVASPERMIFKLNDTNFHFDNAKIFKVGSKEFAGSHLEEFIENHRLEIINSGGPTMRGFMSGARPLFLGLERRMGRYDDEVPFYGGWRNVNVLNHIKKQPREILDGLENCQRLVEKAYTQYRRASDGRVDRLSNIIIESAFEFIEFDPKMLEDSNINPYEELRSLQQRRAEIEKFVRDLGGSEKVVLQIEEFFSKMSGVVEDSKNHKDARTISWFLNISQIQRIRKLLTEMDRQKRFAEKFYAPIGEFCATMNNFLRHSRKELIVDSVGKIKVSQGGRYIDLLNLSSGEKQLLILIAHARFGSTKGRTFIVDEPELSLHMRWQEMLVDALLEGNRENQFIFATHSPEIVGYRTEGCIRLG